MWPAKEAEAETEEVAGPVAGRGKGTAGRSKGRGRGRGRPPLPDAERVKKKVGKGKVVLMLSSLVRAGNQMSNSSSWTIVLKQVRTTIFDNLILSPLSELPETAIANMEMSKSILTMLGKLKSDNAVRVPEALHESATELLRFL